MNALYDLKEMMVEQLEDYGKKGELSSSSLEKIDMLAHATKNICKVIEDCEMGADNMDDYSGRRSRRSYRGSYSSSRRYGRSGRRSYSRNGDLADQLYSMMDEVDDDKTREEMERLASKMEQM